MVGSGNGLVNLLAVDRSKVANRSQLATKLMAPVINPRDSVTTTFATLGNGCTHGKLVHDPAITPAIGPRKKLCEGGISQGQLDLAPGPLVNLASAAKLQNPPSDLRHQKLYVLPRLQQQRAQQLPRSLDQ